MHQFFFRGFEIHRDDITLDQFSDFGADHMRAQQLSGLGIEDDLGHTLVFTERDRLAVADEREAANLDLAFLLFRRLLGQADGRNLRMAIGAARNE